MLRIYNFFDNSKEINITISKLCQKILSFISYCSFYVFLKFWGAWELVWFEALSTSIYFKQSKKKIQKPMNDINLLTELR